MTDEPYDDVQGAPEWSAVEADFRQAFPNLPIDQVRTRYERARNIGIARARHQDWEPPLGHDVAEAIPFVGAYYRTRIAVQGQRAMARIEAGNPEEGDYDTMAQMERVRRLEENRTMGQEAGAIARQVTGFAGEAAIGGGLLRGAAAGEGLLGAVPGVSRGLTAIGLGEAAAARPAISGLDWAASQVRGAGAFGARTAAQTAAMPGMYLEPWAQQNMEVSEHAKQVLAARQALPGMSRDDPQYAAMARLASDSKTDSQLRERANRDPLDWRGLPPAVVVGTMQVALLGSVGRQVNARVPGSGIAPTLTRIGLAGPVGVLESELISTMTSAANLETGYGSVGLLLEGKGDEAWKRAMHTAVTFSAFAAVHAPQERRAQRMMEEITAQSRRMAAQGIRPEAAARRVEEMVKERIESFGPDAMPEAEANRLLEQMNAEMNAGQRGTGEPAAPLREVENPLDAFLRPRTLTERDMAPAQPGQRLAGQEIAPLVEVQPEAQPLATSTLASRSQMQSAENFYTPIGGGRYVKKEGTHLTFGIVGGESVTATRTGERVFEISSSNSTSTRTQADLIAGTIQWARELGFSVKFGAFPDFRNWKAIVAELAKNHGIEAKPNAYIGEPNRPYEMYENAPPQEQVRDPRRAPPPDLEAIDRRMAERNANLPEGVQPIRSTPIERPRVDAPMTPEQAAQALAAEQARIDVEGRNARSGTTQPEAVIRDIREAALQLGGRDRNKPINLADIRDALGEKYPHEQVTEALWELHRRGEAQLVHNDDPRAVTPRDMLVPTLTSTGEPRHYLYFTPKPGQVSKTKSIMDKLKAKKVDVPVQTGAVEAGRRENPPAPIVEQSLENRLGDLRARYDAGERIEPAEWVQYGLTPQEVAVMELRRLRPTPMSHAKIGKNKSVFPVPVTRSRVEQIETTAREKIKMNASVAERLHKPAAADNANDLKEKMLPKSEASPVTAGLDKNVASRHEAPRWVRAENRRISLSEAWETANNPQALKELKAKVSKLEKKLATLKATGGDASKIDATAKAIKKAQKLYEAASRDPAEIAKDLAAATKAAADLGVLYGPATFAPAAPPAVPPTKGISEAEFRQTGLAMFEQAGYIGKTPHKAPAAFLTHAEQLVQSGQMLGNSPLLIHEVAHGIAAKKKVELAPANLPQNVRDGFAEFDYNPNRGPTAVGMQEGFAEWFRRRTIGDLNPAQLTANQKAAAQYAEQQLSEANLTTKANRLAELYKNMAGRSIADRAQGMASPTGQPTQAAGLTAGEGVARRVESVKDETQRLMEHRLLPADQLRAESERLGNQLQPGESLTGQLEITSNMPEQWQSRILDGGVIALVKDPATGKRHERVISESAKHIVEGIPPELLQAQGASFLDAAKKFVGLPVHEDSTWLGTFFLAKNVTDKVDKGFLQAMSQNPKERAESERNINAAVPEQVEAFRRLLNDTIKNDPALFAKAEEAYRRYTAFTDAMLEGRVINGRLTPATAAAWRANEPNYVNLARVMEQGGYTVAIGKRRHGSGRQFVDPMTTLKDLVEVYSRDMARTQIDEALIREGGGQNGLAGVSDFYREIADPKKADTARVDIDAHLQANGITDPAIRQAIMSMIGTEFEMARPWRDGARNVYTAIVDGKPRVLEFHSKSLYDLVAGQTGMNSDAMKGLVKGVAHLVNLPGLKQLTESMKLAATGASTVFPWRNIPIDTPSYMQNVMGRGRGFVQDIMNFVKGHITAHYQKGRKALGFDMNDPMFKAYDEGGGEGLRGPYHYAPISKGEHAWRVVKGEAGTLKDKTMHVIDYTKDVLEMWGAGEHGPRFAEYKNALTELGYTNAQIEAALKADPHKNPIAYSDHVTAMMRAARSTTPFNRQGEFVHEWNKVTPFMSAAIAGLSHEARNWKGAVQEMAAGRFGPKSKAMLGTLAVSIAAGMLHHFTFKDKEWYNELPAHLRYNWWILYQDKAGGVWGVPKPRGILRMVGAYVEEALRASDADTDGDFGMATWAAAQEATPRILPIGMAEGSQLMRNRSWSGRPIVPPASERNDPEFDQWVQYRAPYLADQLSGGLISPRALRPPWEAFQSSRSDPNHSVNVYWDRLNELHRDRTQYTRRMERYPQEQEYDRLHGIEQRMRMLGVQARSAATPERQRDLRRQQIELARRALAR